MSISQWVRICPCQVVLPAFSVCYYSTAVNVYGQDLTLFRLLGGSPVSSFELRSRYQRIQSQRLRNGKA